MRIDPSPQNFACHFSPAAFARGRVLRWVTVVFSFWSVVGSLQAAVLLRYAFEGSNPWANLTGYQQSSAGTVTAAAAYNTAAGTIDTYGSGTSSAGLLLSVNSSAATGIWSAGLNSGVLTLLTANSRALGFLTLGFSLSASSAYPVTVRVQSYDNSPTPVRTGGLKAVILPAAPDFYQRYALDLDKMLPDGTGTFDPASSKVSVSFEIDNTTNGTGWPSVAGQSLKVDNINYSTPKYYVKPASLGGSDSKDGLTELTALATVQAAANKTFSGDNIIAIMDGADYVGTSTNGDLVDVTAAGAPDAWIVFKNYPGASPVLRPIGWNGFKMTNTSAGAAAAFIEIRGLILRGSSYVDANGDRQIAAQYQASLGLAVGSTNTNGIGVDGRSGTVRPRNIRVADNTMEYLAAGNGAGNGDRFTFENNLIRYNCWWNIYACSGISFGDALDTETGANYRMLIQNNVVYGNEGMYPWYSAGAVWSDGNGIIIDSFDAGYTGKTLIQNNLSYNNGGSGIHVLKSSNVDIVHNVAYYNSAGPNLNYGNIFTQSSGTAAGSSVLNVRVMNNIMVARRNPTGVNSYLFNQLATGVASFDPTTIFHQRNVYAGGDVTPPLSGTNLSDNTDLGRTYNAAGLFINPSVDPAAADFHLRAAAAARSYGNVINYRSVRDLALNPRVPTGATDTGAYQTVTTLAYPPMFSPVAGNYTTGQSVSITSDTPGATFVYTTNGTTPTVNTSGQPTNGTLFTAGTPISVSTATTLKAIAWKSGLSTSTVSSAPYTFVDLTSVPTDLSLDTATATYTGTKVVQGLTHTPGAYVRYTTDGTTPTATTGTPQQYRGNTVTDYATFRYRAFKAGRADSAVVSSDVTIHASLGNLSDGSSATVFGAGRIRFAQFLATDTFSAGEIFARLTGLTGGYRAAIYADASGVPGANLAVSSLVSNPVTGWTAFPLTVRVTLAKATYYWLAVWSDNAAAGIYATSTGGTVREVASAFSPTWPSPAGTTTAVSGTTNYAIYATNLPPNLAPVVNAGADQSLSAGATANLSGTVTDDGVPLAPGTVTSLWSVVSGPGTVTFANAASAATSASFSASGTYVLRLNATDALSSSNDDVTVSVGTGGTGVPGPDPNAAVLYRETFGNAGSSNVRLNAAAIGWQQFSATSATANVADTSSTSGGSALGGVAYQTGSPVNVDNVNAGASASVANGFAFSQNLPRALVFTTEYTVDRTAYKPDYFSWYAHLSATSSGTNSQSAAVRIGGQWYVTAPTNNLTVTGSAASFGTSATLCSTSFAASDWRTLTAAIGSPFAVGATSVTLPAGQIDALGVYFTTAGAVTTRFDTFTLTATAVPVMLTPLQTWRMRYFTQSELSNSALEATRWGFLADPDGDGLNNLLEYALGGDPLSSSISTMPIAGRKSDGTLTLTFLRAQSDLTYVVEGSDDLLNWVAIATNPGNVGEVVTVEDVDFAANAHRFLHLRITSL